jgi:CheY-like chemotaxis protein
LILLDLKMPEKSGFQIATELSRLPETSRIPIIAMTGTYNDEAYGPLLRISGFRTCLNKPFDPQEVLKMIRVTLKYEIDK